MVYASAMPGAPPAPENDVVEANGAEAMLPDEDPRVAVCSASDVGDAGAGEVTRRQTKSANRFAFVLLSASVLSILLAAVLPHGRVPPPQAVGWHLGSSASRPVGETSQLWSAGAQSCPNCDCDCGWASELDSCLPEADDGGCCWHCCCGQQQQHTRLYAYTGDTSSRLWATWWNQHGQQVFLGTGVVLFILSVLACNSPRFGGGVRNPFQNRFIEEDNRERRRCC